MKTKLLSRDIVLILAASFFYMSSPMLVTPLITGFSGALGANAALMGVMGGLTNLCSLFCRPFVGNLSDRISKYKLSFIGGGLLLLACAGYTVAQSPVMVAAARLVNGVGFSCCSVCLSTWMSNLLPREKIGSGMGVYGTMNALAMAVAPSIGVSVYQKFGYRTAFLIATAFAVMVILTIQFVGNKGLPAPKPVQLEAAERKSSLQIVDRKVLPIALVVMLFGIPYCATQSFLVSYTETRHLAVTVSLFFPLYAAVLLVLLLSLKSLFDKLPFHCFLFASTASAACGIVLLTVMRSNLTMFLAAMCMAGGYGIMCSVCQSTAILLAGAGKWGLANSTYYIGMDLGMTLGPILGGELMGLVGANWFYPIFLITIPAILLVYLLGIRQHTRH